MIFLVLPCNYQTGWGVCSTNLAREISKKTSIRYVSSEFVDDQKNPLETEFFKSFQFNDLEYLKYQTKYPIIQAVEHDLKPYFGDLSGSFKICITFSDRKIPQNMVESAKKYNIIVAGSEWCKNLLASHNIPSVAIQQGIDPLLFNKSRSKKQIYLDDFVVFSGCKFEFRKGQDVVINAMKVLQDRYPDVKLVCAWSNPYNKQDGKQMCYDAGLDMKKIIFLPIMGNSYYPYVYQNTDIGVFPSRCEAGTNLVLMEYMACGKPVIATVGSGQSDIVNEQNGFKISSCGNVVVKDNNELQTNWEEPDLESVIEHLDYAYNNRSKIKKLGNAGAKFMKNFTWEIMAEKILALIP
jgi:glycosyltransferase involved in cell wall biosynthesis